MFLTDVFSGYLFRQRISKFPPEKDNKFNENKPVDEYIDMDQRKTLNKLERETERLHEIIQNQQMETQNMEELHRAKVQVLRWQMQLIISRLQFGKKWKATTYPRFIEAITKASEEIVKNKNALKVPFKAESTILKNFVRRLDAAKNEHGRLQLELKEKEKELKELDGGTELLQLEKSRLDIIADEMRLMGEQKYLRAEAHMLRHVLDKMYCKNCQETRLQENCMSAQST